MRVIIFILLVLVGDALAADTMLCADNDSNGIVDIVKSVGVIDRDCDGEGSVGDGGSDCDDMDPMIYSGAFTSKGCGAGEYHYCEGGVYKTGPSGSTGNNGCTSSPLCERGTCYYVSPQSGSDTNACTWAAPCATFTKLVNGTITQTTNMAIYLLGATNLTVPASLGANTYTVFDTKVAGTSPASKNIIARYPTSTAQITVSGTCAYNNGNTCRGISIEHSNWELRGFDLRGGYLGSGLRLYGSPDDVEIHGNFIKAVQGLAANNVAGINTGQDGSDNVDIHHNIVVDVQDPQKTLVGDNRQNVYLINLFGNSQNQIVRYNKMGYSHSPPSSPYEVQGGGIRWKHGNFLADMTNPNRAYGNIIWSTEGSSIQWQGPKIYVYGNLILDSGGGMGSAGNSGGDGYFIDDDRVFNNTLVVRETGSSTFQAFYLAHALTSYPSVVAQVTSNIIYDNNDAYANGETAIAGIMRYGSNAEFDAVVTGGKLSISGNCWFNPNISGLTNGFDVFDQGESSGSRVNFAGFRATYGYDTGGYNENPTLNSDYAAQSANCLGRGWVASWPAVVSGRIGNAAKAANIFSSMGGIQ